MRDGEWGLGVWEAVYAGIVGAYGTYMEMVLGGIYARW